MLRWRVLSVLIALFAFARALRRAQGHEYAPWIMLMAAVLALAIGIAVDRVLGKRVAEDRKGKRAHLGWPWYGVATLSVVAAAWWFVTG